jgi:hypothetical protein
MTRTGKRVSRLGMLLTSELLDELRQVFPREPLNLKTDPNEIWYREGQCSVVDVLEAKFKEVNKNLLNQKIL